MNTEFEYMYRDANNYKIGGSAILKGTLTEEEKQAILNKMDGCDGETRWFIPGQVGLPDMFKESGWTPCDDDHFFHEFLVFKKTNEKPNVDMTAKELLARFQAVKKWAAYESDPEILPTLLGLNPALDAQIEARLKNG